MIRKKKNKKVPLGKKPFLVLSRRAIAGWAAALFFVCAWMFVIGVLVGRGTAPLKFNTAGWHKKIASARSDGAKSASNRKAPPTAREKDKTSLDFYEALQENREDVEIERPAAARIVSKKIAATREKPSARKKKPTIAPAAQPRKATVKKETARLPAAHKLAKPQPLPKTESASPRYTVQVASVRSAADADRLVTRLKKNGFAAYRAIGKIPGKGIWYRVRIGKYASKADARPTMEKLKKKGMKPILVKR